MLVIKTPAEIAALRLAGTQPAALLDCVERTMNSAIAGFAEVDAIWSADEFGAFVVVEAGDRPADFGPVGLNPEDGGLPGACWEACYHHPEAGAYEVLVLYGGDEGWSFFVPDDVAALDPALQAKLVEEATAPWWTAAPAAGPAVQG